MYGRLIGVIITLLIAGSFYFYTNFVGRHIDYNNTGVDYYNSGNYDEAIEYYNKALLIKPEIAIYNSNKGLALFYLEDYKKALLSFDNAIKYYNEDNGEALNKAELYSYRGATYHELGKDDKAILDLNKSLEINPDEIKGLYYLSSLLIDKGDYDSALEYINKYLKVGYQDANIILIKGYIYYRMGEIDKAIDEYKISINLDVNNYLGYYYLGEAYIYLEDYKKSLENFKKSLELDQKNYLNLFYIGFSYYKLGDYKNALNYIEESLLLEGAYKDYGVLLYKLVLLDKLGEKSESLEFFKENFGESDSQISDFINLTEIFENDGYESLELKIKELIKKK